MSAVASLQPWPDAILDGHHDAHLLVVDSDEVIPLAVSRWHGPVAVEELALLDAAESPVLDIGCGPGRHAAAFARAGHRALGIDSSPAAVRAALRRGAKAVQVSVFGAVPRPGTWMTALLLDGNIGIGGDPARLLIRVRELLAPAGKVLVEVNPPWAASRRFHAQVRHAGGLGPRFPWACVSAYEIGPVAEEAGLAVARVWDSDSRWFADLREASG